MCQTENLEIQDRYLVAALFKRVFRPMVGLRLPNPTIAVRVRKNVQNWMVATNGGHPDLKSGAVCKDRVRFLNHPLYSKVAQLEKAQICKICNPHGMGVRVPLLEQFKMRSRVRLARSLVATQLMKVRILSGTLFTPSRQNCRDFSCLANFNMLLLVSFICY